MAADENVTQFITVDDIIKRLQDVMAADNNELKRQIGGAVDLETILENTSINPPMSFHVAYVGSTPEDQDILNGEPTARLRDNFVVYAVFNVEKFNGRKPQSMVPKVRQQLNWALWGWEFGSTSEAPEEGYYPMRIDGDSVEYIDRGRYIHVFNYSTAVEIDGNDRYLEGDITPFDSLYSRWEIGEDEGGNTTCKDLDIINIYNDGQPLES